MDIQGPEEARERDRQRPDRSPDETRRASAALAAQRRRACDRAAGRSPGLPLKP